MKRNKEKRGKEKSFHWNGTVKAARGWEDREGQMCLAMAIPVRLQCKHRLTKSVDIRSVASYLCELPATKQPLCSRTHPCACYLDYFFKVKFHEDKLREAQLLLICPFGKLYVEVTQYLVTEALFYSMVKLTEATMNFDLHHVARAFIAHCLVKRCIKRSLVI